MIELTDKEGRALLVNMANVNSIATTEDYSTIYYASGDIDEVIESVGEILNYFIGE